MSINVDIESTLTDIYQTGTMIGWSPLDFDSLTGLQLSLAFPMFDWHHVPLRGIFQPLHENIQTLAGPISWNRFVLHRTDVPRTICWRHAALSTLASQNGLDGSERIREEGLASRDITAN